MNLIVHQNLGQSDLLYATTLTAEKVGVNRLREKEGFKMRVERLLIILIV